MKTFTVVALAVLPTLFGCAKSSPASPPDAPHAMRDCPRGDGPMGGGMMGDGMMGSADGGAMMQSCPMMDGGRMMSECPMMDGASKMMMGGGMMGGGPRMDGTAAGAKPMGMGRMMAHHMAPPIAQGLSAESKEAWTRALDEEYRAEATYASIVTKLGSRPSFRAVSQLDRRQAWILESLGIAHGLELPSNAWSSTGAPSDFKTTAAACRTGLESEKKVVALYDELLKKDLPVDFRRAFEHLRGASADHYLHVFEACR
jgi:hypothetical protein